MGLPNIYLFIYLSFFLSMHARTQIYIHIYIHTSTYAYVHTCMYVYIYRYRYRSIRTYWTLPGEAAGGGQEPSQRLRILRGGWAQARALRVCRGSPDKFLGIPLKDPVERTSGA